MRANGGDGIPPGAQLGCAEHHRLRQVGNVEYLEVVDTIVDHNVQVGPDQVQVARDLLNKLGRLDVKVGNAPDCRKSPNLYRRECRMTHWVVAILLVPRLAAAVDLAGTWEIQAMGGDRTVDVQQRGNTLIAHRVMWPTFEGKKYKLEHLFRGTISGRSIAGDLLVKEEGFADYEILRKFDGSIASNDRITLDGNPMKRAGGKAASAPPVAEPAPAPPPPTTPGASPSPPPPQPPQPTAPTPPADDSPGGGLFARIMSSPGMQDLFDDALKVAIPEEVKKLTAEGDALFRKGQHEAALAKFEEASTTGGGADPQLLHRKGRCLLGLRRWADAKKNLRSALKLDPGNKRIRRDYKKAKRKAR